MAYGDRAVALIKEINQGLEAISPYNVNIFFLLRLYLQYIVYLFIGTIS